MFGLAAMSVYCRVPIYTQNRRYAQNVDNLRVEKKYRRKASCGNLTPIRRHISTRDVRACEQPTTSIQNIAVSANFDYVRSMPQPHYAQHYDDSEKWL